MTDFNCTYCGNGIDGGSDPAAGDALACDGCGATYKLAREDDEHDLVVFDCPYCGHDNKRNQAVDQVRCEDEDCDLVFDPAGAGTSPVDEANVDLKMRPTGWA